MTGFAINSDSTILLAIGICAVLVGAPAISSTDVDESLAVVDFPVAQMNDVDSETMRRYRDNPVNLRCDFVDFDGDPIVELVASIESEVTTIGDSRVRLELPGGQSLVYAGTTFEGVGKHGKNGPFLWEGKLEENGRYFVSLIINMVAGVSAYFTSDQGMYRLSPSSQASSYFLCQRDPTFRAGKVR